MLKKRFLVLALMLCSLAFVASESAGTAKAGAWCTCAATSCNYCSAVCDPDPGTSAEDEWAAAISCCNQNWKGIGCDVPVATSPGGVSK